MRSTESTEARSFARRTKKIATATAMKANEPPTVNLVTFMKSYFAFLKKWSILNGFIESGLTVWSKTSRVTTSAVNIEIATPAVRVIANPRTGPVPTTKRMTPVMMVVRLESKIAVNARA